MRRRGLVLLLALLCAVAAAQSPDPAPDEETVVEDATVPALVAVGLDAGFPAYQTVSVRASLQARWIGVAARGGWGPGSGLYGGATLRAYPPLAGSPVPVWVGGGIGATGAGATPFAAVGAHVPIAQRVRVDVEAGVAFPELLDDRTVAPHLVLGVSYAFPVSLDPMRADEEAAEPQDPAVRYAGAACEPTAPDASRLGGELDDAVDAFVDDARATYGSLYAGLRYSVSELGTSISGDEARIRARYSGSVREIATGERISASGTAVVRLRWTGCEWRRTGISY